MVGSATLEAHRILLIYKDKHMKYTKKQLRSMIKGLYIKIHEETVWERYDDKEIDAEVKRTRFSLIENYSWNGKPQRQDVLFLLNDDIERFHSFIIEDGELIEFHQEHLAEYCLTCLGEENRQAE